MLLTIDVGNTNTVLGTFLGEDLIHSWRVKTDPRSTADELWLQMRALIEDIDITGISLCSTVPAVLYGGPAIVVDFGTSTNLDVVSPKGEFLGGALAPGIEISVDALAQRAAQLRKVELVKPKSVIGKNTVEALQSGTIYGFAGQVDGLVSRISDELEAQFNERPTVIATGGLAPLIFGVAETLDEHERDLTLIGLRLIHERNK